MKTHQVSRRVLCLGPRCSRSGPGFGRCTTPAQALRRPGPFLGLCLCSSLDLDLGLCRSPNSAQELCPGPSPRPGPVRHEPSPGPVSMSVLDWSALLCLCQSSRPALCREPRHQGLSPCWRSSSGPALCSLLGLEATHPLPPALEAALPLAVP